jgi:hypothetical protein
MVVNTGGLLCPAGAVLSFPSSSTVSFNNDAQYVLPAIAPVMLFCLFRFLLFVMKATKGRSFVVEDKRFCGRLFDVPEAMLPGPFQGRARFCSTVGMLNRPFLEGFVSSELQMAYPARIAGYTVAKQMGLNEVGFFLCFLCSLFVETFFFVSARRWSFRFATRARCLWKPAKLCCVWSLIRTLPTCRPSWFSNLLCCRLRRQSKSLCRLCCAPTRCSSKATDGKRRSFSEQNASSSARTRFAWHQSTVCFVVVLFFVLSSVSS